MEIKQLFHILRRWYWLLIWGLVFGLLCGFLASEIMTPVYQGVTKILVSRNPDAAAAEFPSLDNQQLVQTYVELLQTEQIRDQVSEQVGEKIEQKDIIVEQLRDTQIIQIAVEDVVASRAVLAANTLVTIVQSQNDKIQADQYLNAEQSLEEQIAQSKAEIESLQAQIDEILTQDYQAQLAEVDAQIALLTTQISDLVEENARLSSGVSVDEETTPQPGIAENEANLTLLRNLLSTLQSYRTNLLIQGKLSETTSTASENPQLGQLRSTLNLYEQIYFSHLSSLETLRLTRLQNSPTIVQIEPAVIPEDPIRPLPLIYTLLAGIVGLAVAVLAIALIEFLDDTIKTPEQAQTATGTAVLGMIRKVPHLEDHFIKNKDINKMPAAIIYEDYRSLGYQVEFQSKRDAIHSIMVTSCGIGEGTTTTTVNLASIFSKNGKKVLLVDANLRQPRLHHLFKEENDVHVIDLFDGNMEKAMPHSKQEITEKSVLNVISNTQVVEDADTSVGMKQISLALERFQNEKSTGDNNILVIIDAPPASSADAKLLASKADAVLLVVNAWHTHKTALQTTVDMLQQINANVMGIVLNCVPTERAYYYENHHFYQPENSDGQNNEAKETQTNGIQSFLKRIFKK